MTMTAGLRCCIQQRYGCRRRDRRRTLGSMLNTAMRRRSNPQQSFLDKSPSNKKTMTLVYIMTSLNPYFTSLLAQTTEYIIKLLIPNSPIHQASIHYHHTSSPKMVSATSPRARPHMVTMPFSIYCLALLVLTLYILFSVIGFWRLAFNIVMEHLSVGRVIVCVLSPLTR